MSTEITSQPSSERYFTVARPSLPLPPVTTTRRVRAPRLASPKARVSVKDGTAGLSLLIVLAMVCLC